MKKDAVYWKNVICCKCGSDKTFIDSFGRLTWRRYRKNGVWDGKSFACDNCFHKYKTKCRNKQLGKNTGTGKAILSQAVVKKIIGAVDCTIKMNNCNYPIDIFQTDTYGKVDVLPFNIQLKNNVRSEFLGDISKIQPEKLPASAFEKNTWYFCTKRKVDVDTYFCLGFSIDG